MSRRSTRIRPLPCPTCGRFSKDSWFTPYLDEYGGNYGGTCAAHGKWNDGS